MVKLLVDMSMTLIHHGHTRLLQKAAEVGYVIVGLNTDGDILKHKGFKPKLTFDNRKEIALAIRWVDEVLPVPWPLDSAFLDSRNIDFLVRADLDWYYKDPENLRKLPINRIMLFPRTPNISSTMLRGEI